MSLDFNSAFLGSVQLNTSSGSPLKGLTLVASGLPGSVSVLLSLTEVGTPNISLSLRLRSFHGQECIRYRIYTLEDSKTNPQKEWSRAGKPRTVVTFKQIEAIRQAAKWHQTDIKCITSQERMQVRFICLYTSI